MIKTKKHLFEGCPESPVGILDLDMPYMEPQFSKNVRQFVPGYGYVEYTIEKGEAMVRKKKKPKLFQAVARLRRELRQSIRETRNVRLGLPADVDPFDFIGTPMPPAAPPPEAVVAAEPRQDPQEEFEVEIPPAKGPVYETLDAPKPMRIHTDLRKDVTGPSLAIQYENTITAEQERAGVSNGVEMDEAELKRAIRRIDRTTAKAADFMLQQSSPLVLSYDAASRITQTTLRDGLGLDTDIDPDVGVIIGEMAKLDMTMFFLRRTRMPKTVKQLFMNKLTEGVVTATLTKLTKTKTTEEMRNFMEGYLARGTGRGSKAKPADKNMNRTAPDHDNAMAHQPSMRTQRKSKIGVRGSNSGRPIDGGF